MSEAKPDVKSPPKGTEVWLLAATLVVAVAGLIYELIAATVSSYLLGDSVRQFSFVIGVFLTAMGAGAWLSRFVGDAVVGFIRAQLVLGLVGGAGAAVVFFSYATAGVVALPLYACLVAVGILSGMEIPLLARILKQIGASDFRFENVLTVDYLGALVASLAFPILVIPHLSLIAAGFAFGVLNLSVAGGTIYLFRSQLGRGIWLSWAVALGVAVAGLAFAPRLVATIDTQLYEDDIILSTRTPYQQILVTRFQDRTRLYLDGSIQFDTRDEYRYHEALVHPAMAHARSPARVLILGGGDGMAVREALRWAAVKTVTLVDLDPEVTRLFRDHPQLSPLNDRALSDPRVTVIAEDAFAWMGQRDSRFDVIIADLPDPKNLSLSKLYSTEFYSLMAERLAPAGVFVTQAGSPMFARDAFSITAATLEQSRNPATPASPWHVTPYTAYVPSFGPWGFVMGTPLARAARDVRFPEGLRYMTPEVWETSQRFDPDMAPIEAVPNTLQNHILPRAYQAGWEMWFR